VFGDVSDEFWEADYLSIDQQREDADLELKPLHDTFTRCRLRVKRILRADSGSMR